MNSRTRRLAALVALLVLQGALLRGGQETGEWRALALASFDDIWQTINDTYYDPAFGGLDWKGARASFRPRVERATDPDAARRVMRDMLAQLGQSHFVVLSASADDDTLPGDATVPIDIRAVDDGVLVVRVNDFTTSRVALRAGDRITAIDGTDVHVWAAKAEGADPRARRQFVWRRAYRALHGATGSRARLIVVDPEGRSRDVEVIRETEAGDAVTLGNLPPLRTRIVVSNRKTPRGRDVGLIAFNIWMTAVSEPFAAAIDRYRHADGLVIDLRGNPGGLAEMIRGIAGHVLPTPELLGRVHMRGADLEFRANVRRSTSDGRRVEPFAGPLAILVDDMTASTSECFAGGLQSLHRARVFGVQTMGEALPASTKRLPDGDVLMYAIGDFVTGTGQRLEGAGVIPDEIVPVLPRILASGRDPVLEAALAWLDRTVVGQFGSAVPVEAAELASKR